MRIGDLVEIINFNRWGGISRTGRRGIVLNMAYCGYDSDSSRWNVLVDGEVIVFMEKMLGRCPEVWKRLNETR
jgi:hypothetical protein